MPDARRGGTVAARGRDSGALEHGPRVSWGRVAYHAAVDLAAWRAVHALSKSGAITRKRGEPIGDTTVIICVDGLDPEYLEACEAPVMRDLARRGFQETVYCIMRSVTNVNNVSMVTGAYPESNGIWDLTTVLAVM